jgi:hypothetical protein
VSDGRGRSRGNFEIALGVVSDEVEACVAVPFMSVSLARVPPEYSEKPEKGHKPESSTVSVVAKFEISPKKAVGSVR